MLFKDTRLIPVLRLAHAAAPRLANRPPGSATPRACAFKHLDHLLEYHAGNPKH